MALWTSLQTECLYQADLHTIFKSLNILSKVGWVINSDVLKVAEAVWERGGAGHSFASGHSDARASDVVCAS